MLGLRKVCLISLMLILTSLSLSIEAKADPILITLTNTVYDTSPSGSFTLTGFFTNLGTEGFNPNRWELTFSPSLGPHGQTAINRPDGSCCNYTHGVPRMSSSSILPLLTIAPLNGGPPFRAGTYIGTLTFSDDINGFVTLPVQFTVTVTVPEPATIFLLSTGLMAAGASIRRRRIAMKKKPDVGHSSN